MPLSCVDTLDRTVWDGFIATHAAGHLLQSWGWGELKGEFGWDPLRLAVLDGEQVCAAAQVLLRHRFGVSLAYVPRGPAVDWADEAVVETLLAGIQEVGQARRALFLKIEPNLPDDPALHKQLRDYGFRPAATVQPRHSVVIDLQADDDELLARMKIKTRYNVRLAGRRGVTVRPALGPADVTLFYNMLLETAQRHVFGIHTLEYYQAAHRLLNSEERGVLLLAEREGKVLAATWTSRCGPEAVNLYGASRQEGQRHRPTYLLQWEVMRWARDHGCTRYDMWGGIPDGVAEEDGGEAQEDAGERGSLKGVAAFKLGFCGQLGGLTHTVGAYDLAYRPLLYQVYKSVLGG
jgi:lipid II:glycine glycyltransferase (peptidoglycan interpeptide bridge formation enzyme)